VEFAVHHAYINGIGVGVGGYPFLSFLSFFLDLFPWRWG